MYFVLVPPQPTVAGGTAFHATPDASAIAQFTAGSETWDRKRGCNPADARVWDGRNQRMYCPMAVWITLFTAPDHVFTVRIETRAWGRVSLDPGV